MSAFAPVDAAWLFFFTKLVLSREALFESHTALLYDIILGMTISERPGGLSAAPLIDEERSATENSNKKKNNFTESFKCTCRAESSSLTSCFPH